MRTDKALLEIDGEPLWLRQVHLLQALQPDELFITGRAHEGCISLVDAQPETGPLAGVVAGLRACSAPLLLVLAVDLPRMTSDYLRRLVAKGTDARGVVPTAQPLCAIYPRRSLAAAERCLADREYSMQCFAQRCAAERLVRLVRIAINDEPLFLNLNTPEDLRALRHG